MTTEVPRYTDQGTFLLQAWGEWTHALRQQAPDLPRSGRFLSQFPRWQAQSKVWVAYLSRHTEPDEPVVRVVFRRDETVMLELPPVPGVRRRRLTKHAWLADMHRWLPLVIKHLRACVG
jgi:hypothetical protein